MIAAIPPIPPIPPISSGGATSAITSAAGAGGGTSAVSSSSALGGSFQNILGQAIDSLNGVTSNATNVSLQAAAGKATAVDATVATTEAELATQLASSVASKAVVSLNTIMNMQA